MIRVQSFVEMSACPCALIGLSARIRPERRFCYRPGIQILTAPPKPSREYLLRSECGGIEQGAAAFHLSPMKDQQLAGLIMCEDQLAQLHEQLNLELANLSEQKTANTAAGRVPSR
jgi:hypothetical protein